MPPKSKKNAVAVPVVPKVDSMTLLFRREVQSLLGTTPTAANGHPIEVVAAIERLSKSGLQQSVQLCRAGEETWVTRTEGGREYFPRVGRVQKRVRDAEEEDVVEVTPRKAAKVLSTPKGRKAPAAPRKLRHASSPTPDGGETETEGSLRSHETMRRNVIEALGRGKRRARRSEEVVVKAEEEEHDDLASLCGRVGGLEVEGAIDAGSSSFLLLSLRWS